MELALCFLIYIMWKEANIDHRKNIKRIRSINDDNVQGYIQRSDDF